MVSLKLLRDVLVAGMLGLQQVLGSRAKGLPESVEMEEPESDFEDFESFMRYDDVSEPEQWMLFGDDPDLVRWAETRVLARARKCEQVWADVDKRRKLLTGDIDIPTDQKSIDELVDILGVDPDGYWEYDEDDPEAPPTWVEFDESWY